MIGFFIVVGTVTGIFTFGYIRGRDSATFAIEEMQIHIASLEAAQRISLRAWETAKAMHELAQTHAQSALPPERRTIPNN